MPIVKSYGIGNGDMYYIRHGSDNFTIIDCSMPEDRLGSILAELTTQSKDKGITRFISTHPDQDHISGLVELDDHMQLFNFYCVKNQATKEWPTVDFLRYVELRDSTKAYYIYKGCTRRWMNSSDEQRATSGINVLWPDTSDSDFQSALADAAAGMTPNNISPILRYSVENGPSMIWMGDLETDFMEKIADKVDITKTNILFAPHHGRTSGKVPDVWLKKLNPDLVVIGEAPSEYLDYYRGYNIITQNSAGDVLFETATGKVHIYVGDNAYYVNYLVDEGLDHSHGLYYIGTINV
jgi:beta-lactamase superfamily II metal-dependent hydrolase